MTTRRMEQTEWLCVVPARSHRWDGDYPAAGTTRALQPVRFWKRAALCLALATAAPLAMSPPPVRAADALVIVDVVAVAKGYRATALIGMNVTNDKNEKIGSLDEIIIAKKDRVLFAILQVGGFLGLGSSLVAVPYNSLQISDDGSKIVLPGATKEQLKGLPVFQYAR